MDVPVSKMGLDGALGYRMVDTASGLQQAVRTLEGEEAIAVDLESDSMYHYREKVCLLQMATDRVNLLIDPLQIGDLSPLKPLFSSPDVRKILHGADYDVRSLYRDFGIEIANLFDTQLASVFLGIRETGLDAMLSNRFGISLDKRHQKKDWSIRPLPPDMLAYAASDVEHLFPLAKQLEDELRRKNRYLWVVEESEILSKVRPPAQDRDPLYVKFKGAGKLERYPLAVLEALLKFRARVAERRDKPLFKILRNASLMKIATVMPVDMKQLESTSALSRKQLRMYGHTIVRLVGRALTKPEESLPVYPRKKRPLSVPGTSKRIRTLKSWREEKAESLGMDPGLICNNGLVNSISKNVPIAVGDLARIDGIRKWQVEEFGREIVAILRDLERVG